MSVQDQKRIPSPTAGRRGRERSPFYYHSGQSGAQNYTAKPIRGNQPPGRRQGKSKESDHQGQARRGKRVGTGDSNKFTYKCNTGSNGGCQCKPYYWCSYCRNHCYIPKSTGAPTTTSVVSAPTPDPPADRRGSPILPRCLCPIRVSAQRVLQLESEELYGPLRKGPAEEELVEQLDAHHREDRALVAYTDAIVARHEAKHGVFKVTYADAVPAAHPNVLLVGAPLPDAIYEVEYQMEVAPPQLLDAVVELAPEVPVNVLRRQARMLFRFGDTCARFVLARLIAVYAWYAAVPAGRPQPVLDDRNMCAHCKWNRRWTRFGLLSFALTLCWGCCEYSLLCETATNMFIHPALCLTYVSGICYYAWSHLFEFRKCLVHAAQDQANDLGTRIEFVLHNYQSLFMSTRTPDEIKSLKLRFASWLRTNHPDLTVLEATWHMTQSMLGALRLSQCQNNWGMELVSVLPEVWSAHQMSRSGRLESGQYLPSSN
jgi:hypothetical protein